MTCLQVLKDACDIDMDSLYFMSTQTASVYGVPDCRITRCGYTGEDGVEVCILLSLTGKITLKISTYYV